MYIAKLETVKQKDFVFIKDYFSKIIESVEMISIVFKLSKSKADKKVKKCFLRGLGNYTYMELYKQNPHNKSIKEIYFYLERVILVWFHKFVV